MMGWIVNPLVYGDYPEIMKKLVGSRLPSFTKEQSEIVRGSTDFIGINHYTSVYVSDRSSSVDSELRDYHADIAATFRFSRNDPPTGQFIPYNMPDDPQGLQLMLEYLTDTYENVPVYVQENGYGQFFNDSIYDHNRVEYLSGYIGSSLTALRNGANVKGYFVWSFLDVFELLAGYFSRYGLYHVDFQDPELPRQPKLSAQWYSKFLRNEVGIKIESMINPDASLHAEQ
jgi:beta-glucosidase